MGTNMKLSKYSKNTLLGSFAEYSVAKDFADPIYNYLVHGYEPGGFFTAMLANDYMGAISRSHPGNTIEALKALATWIVNEMPKESWGSYKIVFAWLEMPVEKRRAILEESRLIYPEQTEIMMILKDEKTVEPMLW